MLSNKAQRVKVISNNLRGKRKRLGLDDNDFENRGFKKPRQSSTLVSLSTSLVDSIVDQSSAESSSASASASLSLSSTLSSTSSSSSSSTTSSLVSCSSPTSSPIPSSYQQKQNKKGTRSAMVQTGNEGTLLNPAVRNSNNKKITDSKDSSKPVDIKIINKTIEIIPTKRLDHNHNDSLSSEFLPYDKMSSNTLRMQSITLILCLSLLAFIRMYFPMFKVQESYVLAPFNGKFIGLKLRGSFLDYSEVIETKESIPISHKQSQHNYSFDGAYAYSFGGRGLGLSLSIETNHSSIKDDDIRELLASYSSPVTSLSTYIDDNTYTNQKLTKQFGKDESSTNYQEKQEYEQRNDRENKGESKIRTYFHDEYCFSYVDEEELEAEENTKSRRYKKLLLKTTKWLSPSPPNISVN